MAIVYSSHALKRMFQRGLSTDAIEQAIMSGQVIMQYPEDQPYPSRLLLGWVDQTPIHIVAATTENDDTVVITAYIPEPTVWDSTFSRKLA
jgi:Domain of unknown function (DUF4258)